MQPIVLLLAEELDQRVDVLLLQRKRQVRTAIGALRIGDALGVGHLVRFVRVLGVEAVCGRTRRKNFFIYAIVYNFIILIIIINLILQIYKST